MCPAELRLKSRQTKDPDRKAHGIDRVASSSGISAISGVPRKITIRREKDFHTRDMGRYNHGTQFMGFVVGVPPGNPRRKIRWYALVHTFDSQGHHLHTEASFLGTGDILPKPAKAEATLQRMIKKLGHVTYGDIEVCLFSVRIDGHIFGLIDESEPEEDYYMIELVPNGLAFFPPWNGTYET